MKRIAAFAALAIGVGIANIALAGAHVELNNAAQAKQEAARRALYDHPATQVVPAKDIKVVITTDSIMRSCCMPPNLVVTGAVTNLAAHPVNYVKFIFSFENADGKIVYAETIYNLKAASMGEDEEVSRVLNEKPHFDPLPPGTTDQFSYTVPTPLLPRFSKVELYADAVTP
ncbi:MAG TPA: hypothetical protein VJX23_17190 [Candidatus Binataceae bacterium]|nr:hypothetical protein [Candidatus Binataceae bacterium]